MIWDGISFLDKKCDTVYSTKNLLEEIV